MVASCAGTRTTEASITRNGCHVPELQRVDLWRRVHFLGQRRNVDGLLSVLRKADRPVHRLRVWAANDWRRLVTPLDNVLSRLPKHQKDGKGFKACCPAHDDKNPSLGISEGEDGRVLLKCWAGCATEAIVGALGLEMQDLFDDADRPMQQKPAKADEKLKRIFATAGEALKDYEKHCGKPSATWTYSDREGAAIGIVVRWDKPDGKKDIRPISKNCSGWYQGGMPEPRPIYRLPEVIESRGWIYVVEGEKCAEAVRSIGLTATTSPHGSNSAHLADWSALAGKDLVISPDNDPAGEKYMNAVVEELRKLSPAPRIKVLRLPGLADGEDIADWIDRRDAAENETIRRELERLVEDSNPFEAFVGSPPQENQKKTEEWTDPKPLPGDLLPVMPFDLELLPDAFRARARDISGRMSCPPDYSAVSLIIAAASVIGRRVAIRPKRHDDWTVICNLWGCCVGRPGLMKTSAVQQGIHPLRVLAKDANELYQQSAANRQADKELAALKVKRMRKDIAAAVDSGEVGDDELRRQLIQARNSEESEDTPARRYIVMDSTYEAVSDMLKESPNGFLQYRDELAGWWASLSRDGQENARSFWLEVWNGDGDYYIDRVMRGRIYVPSNTVSVLGATQPGKLRAYLAGAIKGDSTDDGMIQRHQMLVWPDASPEWQQVDQWPDTNAKRDVVEVFRRLDRLEPSDVQAIQGDGDEFPFLRFDPSAQSAFDEWLGRLERHLRSDKDPPHLESHFSKYRSLIPSLALIFHLVDGRTGSVGIDSVSRAIRWGEYLATHARRAYGGAHCSAIDGARRLLKKIVDGDLEQNFSIRDVYVAGWTGLTTSEEATAAVNLLADFGWVRVSKIKTGGRPSLSCQTHPKISVLYRRGTDRTDKSPPDHPSDGFVGDPTQENPDFSAILEADSECVDFDQINAVLGGRA